MELFFFAVVFSLAIWWLATRGQAANSPPPGMRAPLLGSFPPSGEYEIHIVGESHYQKHLKLVLKTYGRGEADPLIAFIVTEPKNPYDKNACAVYIAGDKVGHLSREDAAEYVRQMRRNKMPAETRFQVAARLIGGEKGKPNIGVMLDLPLAD